MAENQPQQQPTSADFALKSLADDLTNALSMKAVYYGESQAAQRTNHLLAQENQELRSRLQKYEQRDAEPVAVKDPDPVEQQPADSPTPRTRTPKK